MSKSNQFSDDTEGVRCIHFVTGKGGVGKSTVAAALAMALAKTEKSSLQKKALKKASPSILLTELNETSFYKEFLGIDKIGYKPQPWSFGEPASGSVISVSQWSPEECLKEYALHLIKIESLCKLFLENPVSKSLIQIAPGVQELALLGKVTSSPRKHGPPMQHSQIVIDAFSTGHFLALLRAPAAMAEAVQFGPMGEQSRSINRCLMDPKFTKIHIVTLAEELAITEAFELHVQLKQEFGLSAHVYLNKLLDLNPVDVDHLKKNHPLLHESLMVTLENENWARKQLTKNGISFFELPLQTSLVPSEIVCGLAACILHLQSVLQKGAL